MTDVGFFLIYGAPCVAWLMVCYVAYLLGKETGALKAQTDLTAWVRAEVAIGFVDGTRRVRELDHALDEQQKAVGHSKRKRKPK